jgi:histidine triad (HIT) family protein
MASIFTKIISGELPCYKIAETTDFIAFLDVNPLMKGHTLVVPKIEVDYIFSMPDDLYTGLWAFAKKIALAIEIVVPCQRIGTAVIGLEVKHTHIHLLPINKVSDINFANPKLKFPEVEMQETAYKIANALNTIPFI